VPSAHCNLAIAYRDLRDFQAALASVTRAITLDPSYVVAYLNRASILIELNHREAALQDYNEAIAIDASVADAWYGRGGVQHDMGDLHEAFCSLHRAITLNPKHGPAHHRRANVLRDSGESSGALAGYELAEAAGVRSVTLHLDRGALLAKARRLPDALRAFDQAVLAEPSCAAAHFKEKRDFAQPRWMGEPVAGKTLLLYAEQGFGDTLQFCRYAALAAARGAQVLLEVPAELTSLLASLAGPLRVLVRGDALPEFDFQCPLMSLPLAFGTTVENIPRTVPYLSPDPARIRRWGSTIGAVEGFRVGLVWSGRPLSEGLGSRAEFNSRRDVPVAALAALSDLDARFFSLQTGPAAGSQLAELSAQWGGTRIVDLGKDLADFADTAAAVSQLDLVITVDTATAHLAGALGRPVWILNRLDTCWRWLMDRSDSPWYPTATIFRQTRRGSWDDVLVTVRTALQILIENRLSAGAAT
jgi:Tfp pilus assembly protein PilF